MKYTILGFNQIELINCGLDLTDTMILRWFLDFIDSNKMETKIIGKQTYYWLNYDYLINEMPVLKLKSKDALRRRLKKICDKNILIHATIKKGGSFSYYGIGKGMKNLIFKC